MSNHDILAALLSGSQRERKEPEAMPELQAQTQVHTLRDTAALYLSKFSFKAGDLVQWKPGMATKKSPKVGQPAIVMQVLHEGLIDDAKDLGSPYRPEPLDLVLGMISDTGDFLQFHHHSARFEPFPIDPSYHAETPEIFWDSMEWLCRADELKTSPRIMEAISDIARSPEHAEQIWEDPDPGDLQYVFDRVTEGDVSPRMFYWGASGTDWANSITSQ